MTEQLGAPQPATVIAISMHARSDLARRHFTDLLGSVMAHACHIQPATGQSGELAYTAIIPDNAQTLSMLRRLLSLQTEFAQSHPDCTTRFIIHHGLIFPSAARFLGAALRSAHSRLARLPANIRSAATVDFAEHVDTWPSKPITFSPLYTDSATVGLMAFSIQPNPDTEKPASLVHEVAFLRHLTTCLANHIGPFAEVIVDAARRSSTGNVQLIEELANEIEAPKAREKFRSDALAFSIRKPN